MNVEAAAAPHRHVCCHCNTAFNDFQMAPSPCLWCHRPAPIGPTTILFEMVGVFGQGRRANNDDGLRV